MRPSVIGKIDVLDSSATARSGPRTPDIRAARTSDCSRIITMANGGEQADKNVRPELVHRLCRDRGREHEQKRQQILPRSHAASQPITERQSRKMMMTLTA